MRQRQQHGCLPLTDCPPLAWPGLSLDSQDVTVAASRVLDGHPLDVLLLTPAAARRLAIVLEAIAAEEM